MSRNIIAAAVAALSLWAAPQAAQAAAETAIPKKVTITKDRLLDKIKGAWAGKTIGCSYGGPVEFRYLGSYIQDYTPLEWTDSTIVNFYNNWPELYDDLYVGISIAEVAVREGLDAPADSFAVTFARAPYPLWHANMQARYNINQGVMPPESGHWLNNPHADDIDFQIEADFIGVVTPGMPVAEMKLADKIGHIFNYGNGYYGGLFVGALYSLAFVIDDIPTLVAEAARTVPAESEFRQCIEDVLRWHREFPDDWQRTWFEIQRKYSEEVGCPEGVFVPLDIDAMINSAYVVVGLLYGEGDFFRTMDISTRCGQDADCNPSTACGVLATVTGYDAIPGKWRRALTPVLDRPFRYTDVSLNKLYGLSLDMAIENVVRNGGKVKGDMVTIKTQEPQPAPLERSFEGHHPSYRMEMHRAFREETEFDITGNGFAINGWVGGPDLSYQAEVEVWVDGSLNKRYRIPTANKNLASSPVDYVWVYNLPEGKHHVKLKVTNPRADTDSHITYGIVYTSQKK